MELYKYTTTALEDWVVNFYNRMKIVHPKEIDIEYMAKRYEVFINYWDFPSKYVIKGRFRGVYIDRKKSKEHQREIFFHEFAHILRHTGVQTMLPSAFRELQEWDARHFTKYAAIPYHMLQFIDFEDEYVIDQMANLFKVSPELCEERLGQIYNRLGLFNKVSTNIINYDGVGGENYESSFVYTGLHSRTSGKLQYRVPTGKA